MFSGFFGKTFCGRQRRRFLGPPAPPRRRQKLPGSPTLTSAHGSTLYLIRSHFEPVEFFENRSDVVLFWGFSDSTGESIMNSLEAVYLGDAYVEEERLAVV